MDKEFFIVVATVMICVFIIFASFFQLSKEKQVSKYCIEHDGQIVVEQGKIQCTWIFSK